MENLLVLIGISGGVFFGFNSFAMEDVNLEKKENLGLDEIGNKKIVKYDNVREEKENDEDEKELKENRLIVGSQDRKIEECIGNLKEYYLSEQGVQKTYYEMCKVSDDYMEKRDRCLKDYEKLKEDFDRIMDKYRKVYSDDRIDVRSNYKIENQTFWSQKVVDLFFDLCKLFDNLSLEYGTLKRKMLDMDVEFTKKLNEKSIEYINEITDKNSRVSSSYEERLLEKVGILESNIKREGLSPIKLEISEKLDNLFSLCTVNKKVVKSLIDYVSDSLVGILKSNNKLLEDMNREFREYVNKIEEMVNDYEVEKNKDEKKKIEDIIEEILNKEREVFDLYSDSSSKQLRSVCKKVKFRQYMENGVIDRLKIEEKVLNLLKSKILDYGIEHGRLKEMELSYLKEINDFICC